MDRKIKSTNQYVAGDVVPVLLNGKSELTVALILKPLPSNKLDKDLNIFAFEGLVGSNKEIIFYESNYKDGLFHVGCYKNKEDYIEECFHYREEEYNEF